MLAPIIVGLLSLQQTADPRLQGAVREDQNGWVYAHLQGSPNQIGFQYGYLIAPEIDEFCKVIKLYLKQTTEKDWNFYRDAAKRIYWPKVESEYKQEILGMAEGLRARGYHYDSTDMLVQNAWIEFAWYYAPYLKDKATGGKADSKAPAMCSAFVATGDWTKDGHPVMAHTSWVDYVIGERDNLILDVVPEHGNRFIMDAFPGLIDSANDFVINSAGILITETTIVGFKGFDEKGIPEFDRSVKAAQYSNNLEDFNRYMTTGNNGAYANTWLVADTKTNEVGELELGLKHVTFKRSNNGFFVGSNFPQDANLIAEEIDPKQCKERMCLDRRTRWLELMQQNKGKIDIELAKQMLGDHHDAVENKDGPSSTTICGHIEEDTRKGINGTVYDDNYPAGSVQAKAVDTEMAKHLSLWARMGHPCGESFIAQPFLQKYPQFAWQSPYLRDMPGEPWTVFKAR